MQVQKYNTLRGCLFLAIDSVDETHWKASTAIALGSRCEFRRIQKVYLCGKRLTLTLYDSSAVLHGSHERHHFRQGLFPDIFERHASPDSTLFCGGWKANTSRLSCTAKWNQMPVYCACWHCNNHYFDSEL